MKVHIFFFKIFILLSFIIGLSSCADKITTIDNITAPQENNPKSNPSLQLSKFSELQNNLFTPTCAVSGCHDNITKQANMNLTSGNAYSNLVNVQSILFPNLKRVVPGNAAQSLIYRVLSHDPGLPLQMPPSGIKIDQKTIDSIAVWINKGAPND